jgi:hypothetical protein
LVIFRATTIASLLLASVSFADAQVKSYRFGECRGHKTICDDKFNEVISLRVHDDGTVTTDIHFDHPHIVAISASKLALDGSDFNSAHLITNNLGHEFTFEIRGNSKDLAAEEVIIHLGKEHLASIKLVASNRMP